MDTPSSFDPYYVWLGIPRANRPPSLYRLLDVEDFEKDLDVIEVGYERRMLYLQRIKDGEHSDFAEQLMSELAMARRRLLIPEKKESYDTQLRNKLEQTKLEQTKLEKREEAETKEMARSQTTTTEIQLGGLEEEQSARSVPNRIWAVCLVALVALLVFGALAMRWRDESASAVSNPASQRLAATGTQGYALYFDGKSSFVRVPDYRFEGVPPLTVEAIVRPIDLNGTIAGDAENGGWVLSPWDAWFRHGGSYQKPLSFPTPDPDWLLDLPMHIAATYSGREMGVYVNGHVVEKRKLGDGEFYPSNLPTIIGANPRDDGECELFFHGYIEQVHVCHELLYTQEQFERKSDLEKNANTQLLFKFNRELEDDQAYDASGHERHGQIVNAKWTPIEDIPQLYSTASVRQAKQRNDPRKVGLQFNRTRIIVPSFNYDGTWPITIEAFLQTNKVVDSDGRRLNDVRAGAIASDYKGSGIFVSPVGCFAGRHQGQAVTVSAKAEALKKIAGQRVHIAATHDPQAKQLAFYLDGKIQERKPLSSYPPSRHLFNLGVDSNTGLTDGGKRFAGLIEQFRISNSIRYVDDQFDPDDELLADADTQLLFQLNEGMGPIAVDSSGNENHGLILGRDFWRSRDRPGDRWPQ